MICSRHELKAASNTHSIRYLLFKGNNCLVCPNLAVGLFAGALDYKKLPLLLKLILKAMKTHEGDFRDWEEIHAWAAGLRPALLGA